MTANIYNISAEKSFVDELARHFLKVYQDNMEELSRILFLLPTRRACQNLADAFLRQRGLQPTILPRMEPIADIEEDEVFLSGDVSVLKNIQPAMDDVERVFMLTRMILQKSDMGGQKISMAQAYALASNLVQLMDATHNYNLSFSRLSEIVPEEYAAHWQETLKLLDIITDSWPRILQERGMVDTVCRRQQLLEAELSVWQNKRQMQKIVIAGTTAVFPLMKKMVKTVSELPQGEIYLYGLDYCLEDEDWKKIDENHPQFELKQLLEYLNIERRDILCVSSFEIACLPREKLVSELMRPAETSSKWLELSANPLPKTAFEGIELISCDDLRQEASAIALIMRQTLETPEKTVALVTADRNLARRVVSELKKWNISADDSAGQPLSLTPIGIFLRLIADATEQQTQTAYMALLKHPFTTCGYDKREYNLLARRLELFWRGEIEMTEELQRFYQNFMERLRPLEEIFKQKSVAAADLFLTHIQTAEKLADTTQKSGEKIIWQKDAGAMAANFVSSFLAKCPILGDMQTADYNSFITMLLGEKNVRMRYGMHPRVKILGPIEARLSQFDVTIIGEANEGSWPKLPNADMWMSRPMRHEFGLPLPEYAIGVMAADFAHLMCAPKVYVTRAERIDGTPTKKSRWWLRFETVINANFSANKSLYDFLYDKKFASWSKNLVRPTQYKAIKAPCPCPPLDKRPRVLSASGIEKLLRDPYAVFARYILSLKPLDELDREKQASDFGNIMHKVLQNYNNQNNRRLSENAEDDLLNMGRKEFADSKLPADKMAFWWPRFEQSVKWYVQTERQYRPEVDCLHNETEGKFSFHAPAGDFTVTAKADRIDETKDGRLNILDYKTGRKRSVKEMVDGKAPQLPLEGLIAEHGGFPHIPAKKVNSLRYWGFNEKEVIADSDESAKAIEKTHGVLCDLIALFDNPQQPYLTKPIASNAPNYSDYDHLSRFLEWSVKDDAEDKKHDA